MTALLDTNVLIRHLTGDPPDMAAKASAYLLSGRDLVLTDLVVAEIVYVLESFYQQTRVQVVGLVAAVVSSARFQVQDRALLIRSLEVYVDHKIDFTEAYLVASAEKAGITEIASFDRAIDRVPTITRIEP
ncbi:PIN domain-containing protein [Candidatus Poriferisocius sp.]|uniref:PIN domain-containing protein n=1 Tax=Candidatus Poriferisocius sp. TaxID=3101276 RepID=UPI003B51A328